MRAVLNAIEIGATAWKQVMYCIHHIRIVFGLKNKFKAKWQRPNTSILSNYDKAIVEVPFNGKFTGSQMHLSLEEKTQHIIFKGKDF